MPEQEKPKLPPGYRHVNYSEFAVSTSYERCIDKKSLRLGISLDVDFA